MIVRPLLSMARRVGFDYTCFDVYMLPLHKAAAAGAPPLPHGYRFLELSGDDMRSCPDPDLEDCASYAGSDARLFGIVGDEGRLTCVQCIWFGERYAKHAFWPIEAGSAVSMHLVTARAERGRGLATQLKARSAGRLAELGFSRIYSRIWWTNAASIRVSEKAGWSKIGRVIEVFTPLRRGPWRMVLGAQGQKAARGAGLAAGVRHPCPPSGGER